MTQTLLKPSRPIDVPILLFLSFGLLITGLILPVMTVKKFLVLKDSFSVLTGIQALYRDGYIFLAAIVFLFSVIFPAMKLLLLMAAWIVGLREKSSLRIMAWVSLMGKWSMLDVFVVAMTIVITKATKLIDAQPRVGIYIFCGSIILTILAGIRIESVQRRIRNKSS